MIRVCKPSGNVIIISHGCPEKRMKEFSGLERINEVEIKGKKIKLSDLAQLINLLRSEKPDKPLSYALKETEYLKKALKERNYSNFNFHKSDYDKKGRRITEVKYSKTKNAWFNTESKKNNK